MNPLRFWLTIAHTSVGLSFRETAAVIAHHCNRTKIAKLSGLNDRMVGQFVRIIVGVSLQIISKVLSSPSVWAFSLAGDTSNHFGVSLFDERIRVCVDRVLYNLHWVIVPFFERQTAINHVKLIESILDNLYTGWRDKLISVSSDGENTMTGRHGGIVHLLEQQCNNKMLRILCPAHQLDLVVKRVTRDLDGGDFYSIAHAFSVYLRTQQNLITDMGSKCPKDTTRWLQLGNMLKWKLEKRRRLMQHIDEQRPVQAPSESWWILSASLSPSFDSCNITMTTIQSKDLVISQQREEIARLIRTISTLMDIRKTQNTSCNALNRGEHVLKERYYIGESSIKEHIHDQGSWVRDRFQKLPNNDQESIITDISNFVLVMVNDFFKSASRA
jgi:hypothetical protein